MQNYPTEPRFPVPTLNVIEPPFPLVKTTVERIILLLVPYDKSLLESIKLPLTPLALEAAQRLKYFHLILC